MLVLAVMQNSASRAGAATVVSVMGATDLGVETARKKEKKKRAKAYKAQRKWIRTIRARPLDLSIKKKKKGPCSRCLSPFSITFTC
jgi:aspartokinase